MRAVVCAGYGPPGMLRVEEVPRSVPGAGEVRVRVVAGTVHVGDTRVRRADPFLARFVFGLLRPRQGFILGMELAGVVDAVGPRVTAFTVGDEVMALCGFGFGGNAEYRVLPVRAADPQKTGIVIRKPEALSFEEAAAFPAGALTAWKNLQKAQLRAGHRVLINGASGSLGTYAIQLAKDIGAEVTAVCSGHNRDLVTSLGADEVVDRTRVDFTRLGDRFDVVYDAVATSTPRKCRRLLRPGGVHVRNHGLSPIVRGDLEHLAGLAAGGKLRPVVDRVYLLDQVADAHRYVDTGRKRGNVVLTIASADMM